MLSFIGFGFFHAVFFIVSHLGRHVMSCTPVMPTSC